MPAFLKGHPLLKGWYIGEPPSCGTQRCLMQASVVSLADNFGLFLLFPYPPLRDFFRDSLDPHLWSVLGVCDPEEVTQRLFILCLKFCRQGSFRGKSQSLSAASGQKDCPWSPSCSG